MRRGGALRRRADVPFGGRPGGHIEHAHGTPPHPARVRGSAIPRPPSRGSAPRAISAQTPAVSGSPCPVGRRANGPHSHAKRVRPRPPPSPPLSPLPCPAWRACVGGAHHHTAAGVALPNGVGAPPRAPRPGGATVRVAPGGQARCHVCRWEGQIARAGAVHALAFNPGRVPARDMRAADVPAGTADERNTRLACRVGRRVGHSTPVGPGTRVGPCPRGCAAVSRAEGSVRYDTRRRSLPPFSRGYADRACGGPFSGVSPAGTRPIGGPSFPRTRWSEGGDQARAQHTSPRPRGMAGFTVLPITRADHPGASPPVPQQEYSTIARHGWARQRATHLPNPSPRRARR